MMKTLTVIIAILLFVGCSTHKPQDTLPAEAAGMSAEKLALALAPLQQAVDSGHIGAAVALIAQGSEIVSLQSFGWLGENIEMPTDAICRMASIGKTITATAIMKLYERDLLDLHDPVSDYLPEYEKLYVGEDPSNLNPAKNPMTIFHLLTHQSGLASRGNEFWNVWDQAKTVREFASMIASLPLEFEPGADFRYGQMGSGYEVLAAVAEVAAGKRFDKIIQDEILDPLEMKDTYFNVPESKRDRLSAVYVMDDEGRLAMFRKAGQEEPASEFFAGGGALRATITDYYRFVQCLLDDGMYKGQRILSPESVAQMTTNQVPGGAWNAETGWGFGTAVQLNDEPPGSMGSFGWNGGTGTMYLANKKLDWTSIIFIPSQPRTPYVRDLRNQFIESSFKAIAED